MSEAKRPPLTEEELELLATPNQDIRTKVSQFCFDPDKFTDRIFAGERWRQLLQAHLYFDHVITRTLTDALSNPDALNLRRTGFYQKLQLIAAMDLLPASLTSVIEFINALRNKIAHDLDFVIRDDDVNDLINCTPKHLRDVAEEEERRSGPLQFHELLRVILFQIEVVRQDHEYQRMTGRKMGLRLRAVLDKQEVTYRE
jgi:hypothetical protein